MTSTSLNNIIGDWRRTHTFIFIFVQFSYFLYGWQSLELTFLTPQLKYRCANDTSVFEQNTTSSETCSSSCSPLEFDKKYFQETLTEKLSLVCDRAWLQSFSTTILMISGMVMNFVAGDFSDRFGRRKTVLYSLIPYAAGVVLILFPVNYAMFALGVVLVGMAFVAVANFSYVLLYELTGENIRSSMGVSIEIGFNLGAIVVGGVAWALPNWFHIQLVNCGLVSFLVLAWFLPESPSWFIEKGRSKEAIETVKYITKINKHSTKTDEEIEATVQKLYKVCHGNTTEKSSESSSMKDLFILPEFRTKTLCICYFWFTTAFVFYGFSLNVNIFGGNFFLSFILSALSSLPAIGITLLLLRVIQLKWIIIGCNILAALTCFIYKIGEGMESYRTAIVVLGWFFTAPAFVMLLAFTADMYPTSVRGKATGLGSFMSRLGSALAPFAKELGNSTYDYVPLLLFGVMCTVHVIIMARLGEGTQEFDLTGGNNKGGHDNVALDLTKDIQLAGVQSLPVTHHL